MACTAVALGCQLINHDCNLVLVGPGYPLPHLYGSVCKILFSFYSVTGDRISMIGVAHSQTPICGSKLMALKNSLGIGTRDSIATELCVTRVDGAFGQIKQSDRSVSNICFFRSSFH